jgi:hypothetical protein
MSISSWVSYRFGSDINVWFQKIGERFTPRLEGSCLYKKFQFEKKRKNFIALV